MSKNIFLIFEMGAWYAPNSLSRLLHGSVKQSDSSVHSSQNKPKPTFRLARKMDFLDHDYPIKLLSIKNTIQRAPLQLFLHDMKSESGFLDKKSTNWEATILSYAENGHVQEAQTLWDEFLNSSFQPSTHFISSLIIAYAKTGNFDQITGILTQIKNREFSCLPQVYSLAIKCFGMGGKIDSMEHTLNQMVAMGFQVNSTTANAYVVYYSIFGSLSQMEVAYARLRRSRILIEEGGIKAVSFAYMKERKFYKLGEFLRNVGLGRKNVGNLLWNLLLLSYAANFKMKSLQREFLAMAGYGFKPDLTTFNIRSLAFSRMDLFWDLHLTLEHMRHENVAPDLVTYGCVVDLYMDKRMGRNLDFALKKMMNLDEYPLVVTEPFVFEVMGKGEFHLASEAFLEFNKHKRWTYRKLIGIYVKKKHRSNQIFWNY